MPTTGAVGVTGCAFITTGEVEPEVQPASFATLKVYDPAESPVTVVLVPEPVDVPPGVRVRVHVPDDGNPFRITLPVADAHVG